MNRGDTACLLLDYKINDEDLVEDAYQEIELQINEQTSFFSVKKKLSDGGIAWQTVSYTEDDQTLSFTGYVAFLNQEETFKLLQGKAKIQLRIMMGSEVGSSPVTILDIGNVLSDEVL